MAITYTWAVKSIKVKNEELNEDVVVQTYWTKTGVDENGNEGVFHGATPFTRDPTDSSGPFIPFEQLTEQDVLSWIQSQVTNTYEDHVNERILKMIEEKAAPVVEKTMPWDTEPSPDAPA
jgi:hypothetical protein